MKSRFILFRRAGVFYSEDTTTRKQTSLRTKDEAEALTLLHSKNEAHRQPTLNLHIARAYAWAERAKTCGYPERFAQAALGHNSKAVHRAYAKKAHVLISALDEYERKMATADNVIVPMAAAVA